MKRAHNIHRGAMGDPVLFATDFIQTRLGGFAKDMEICLAGVAIAGDASKLTHAYFPALMGCCGTVEYLAGLSIGHLNRSLGHVEIASYAGRYMGASYDPDTVQVLFDAFRHRVAHRGITTGIWLDRVKNRRLTWRVSADDAGPAVSVEEDAGTLSLDSPWPVPYSHRAYVRIGRLWKDIYASGGCYLSELRESPKLQERFMKCMRYLYPT